MEINKENKQVEEVITFPVPLEMEEITNIKTIKTNPLSELSNEQIINKAIKLHLQGNVKDAGQYYQYLIRSGFKDHRVFANYGLLLKDIGKLKKAEICQRRAIEIKPNFAEAYFNLGNILLSHGRLEEAKSSTLKAINLKPDLKIAQRSLGVINLINTINNGEYNTSKESLIELTNNFPESRNENIDQFFKSWSMCIKNLIDENKFKQLLPIFVDLIILGERNLYVRSLNEYIFGKFRLKSILNLVGQKDKILITLAYCEYKAIRKDYINVEDLSTQNIMKTEILFKSKDTVDLGWSVIRRSLKLFQNKHKGREILLSLIQRLRK